MHAKRSIHHNYALHAFVLACSSNNGAIEKPENENLHYLEVEKIEKEALFSVFVALKKTAEWV